MTQYQDIYMRDVFGDTGQIPDPVRINWVSPDIIPYGVSQYSGNWQAYFASIWNQDVGVNPVAGQTNYIYVRGMNAYPGAETGTIQLYYANSSLLLQPSQWLPNQISTANSTTTAVSATAQNAIVVGADAFQWVPPSSNAHYCLIALVGTPFHQPPVPTGDFPSSAAFLNWLVMNPAAVQRNLTIVANPPPPSWQSTQTFLNADAVAEEYLFQADISALPAGTVVSFNCSATGPTPPINVTKTVPTNGPSPNWISCLTQLPASFTSSLVLTIQVPAGSSPPAQGLVIDYARVVNATDHPVLVEHAKAAEFLYPNSELGGIQVVIMGSCAIRYRSPSHAEETTGAAEVPAVAEEG